MDRPTDQDLDRSIAAMLRIGVSLAAVIVVFGGVLLLRQPWTPVMDYRHFQDGNPALRTLRGVLEGAVDLAPKSVIQLGLIVLVATPVARVAFCVVGFARQKSKLYVGISLLVLAILLYSLLKGTF
jgi:uncharacterized membrane protein